MVTNGHAGTGEVHAAWAHAMCSRLSADPQLVLPSRMYQEAEGTPSSDKVQAYLAGLISRDPSAYLEKYGKLLKPEELALFHQFSSDFEVAHWLRTFGAPMPDSSQLEDQHAAQAAAATAPAGVEPAHAQAGVAGQGTDETPAAQWGSVEAGPSAHAAQQVGTTHTYGSPPTGKLSAVQKNRRLAAMQRMQQQGEFFSEDTMRQRAPLLYHQLIGQYTGEDDPLSAGLRPPGGSGGGGGARHFSEVLMRQHEELQVMQQLAEEQRIEEEQMSEHESDEEEEEEEEEQDDVGQEREHSQSAEAQAQARSSAGKIDAGAGGGAGPAKKVITMTQLARNRVEFQQEMELRFLYGQDAHIDYAGIDADTDGQLDAHWAKEAGRDAEDAYFDDMEDGEDWGQQVGEQGAESVMQEGGMEYDY